MNTHYNTTNQDEAKPLPIGTPLLGYFFGNKVSLHILARLPSAMNISRPVLAPSVGFAELFCSCESSV